MKKAILSIALAFTVSMLRTTFMPPFVFVVKYRSKNKILNPDEAPIWRR